MATDRSLVLVAVAEIIINWASIEKYVAKKIIQLEMLFHVPHTDLSHLQRFKRRKGYLRKLVEAYCEKDQLSELDAIFREVTKYQTMRHSLSHDLVYINDSKTGVTINTLEDFYALRREPSKTYSLNELQKAARNLSDLSLRLIALSNPIFDKLDAERRLRKGS